METTAVILAAGMGTRLGKYTSGLPKCMLEFAGKPLIQWQVETLQASGIEDIVIVRGYEAEKINISGVTYRENPIYAKTNMVATLMEAEQDISKDKNLLVCYADILYERALIDHVQNGGGDVTVLADEDWIEYWQARLDNWEDDVESLILGQDDKIIDIGNTDCQLEDAHVRYIGLIKFSPEGIGKLLETYRKNKEVYWESDKPWLRSKSFKKAYMTCMLQALIDEGVDVRAEKVRNGWMEFDTVDDYERANKWLKEKTLDRFIEVSQVGKEDGC